MWVSIWVTSWLSSLEVIIVLVLQVGTTGLRMKEDDGAAAQLAGGDAETAEIEAEFGKRHLRGPGFHEQCLDAVADLVQQRPGIRGRHRGGDDAPVAVHGHAAGRKLLHAGARPEPFQNFFQESHEAVSFLDCSSTWPATASGGQPTRKVFSPSGRSTYCLSRLEPVMCESGPASSL